MADNVTGPRTDISTISVDGEPPVDFPPYKGGANAAYEGANVTGYTTGTPPSPGFLSDLDTRGDKAQAKIRTAAGYQARDDSYIGSQLRDDTEKHQKQMEESWNAERYAAHDPALRPWNADEEKAARVRGPMEQFGSVGFIFAMAASAFTRSPMTSALNAGAAAMTAIQEGDEKSYKSAYQAWKDNSDLALRRFDMEHRLYEDANQLLTTDMNLWKTKTAMIAAQFNDQTTLAMLDAGMYPQVVEMKEKLAESAIKVRKAQEGFQEFDGVNSLWTGSFKAWKEEHPNASQLEQYQAKMRFIDEAKKAYRGTLNQNQNQRLTPDQQQYDLLKQKYGNDPDKLAEKFGEYKRGQHQPAGQAAATARAAKQVQAEQQRKAVVDDYVTDIDTALQRVQTMKGNFGPQVGSAAGATKLFQTATGKTDVADLQRNLAQLKEHYKEVFSGKGRALSAEFKELDTLIPGEIQGFNLSLNKGFSFPRFDRLQNVENALVDLRERIKKRYDDLITVEGPAETPAAPVQGGVHELSTEELRQQLIERGYDPDKL